MSGKLEYIKNLHIKVGGDGSQVVHQLISWTKMNSKRHQPDQYATYDCIIDSKNPVEHSNN